MFDAREFFGTLLLELAFGGGDASESVQVSVAGVPGEAADDSLESRISMTSTSEGFLLLATAPATLYWEYY